MSDRFSDAIALENNRGYIAVIPDIKCISPKVGNLLQGRDPAEVAQRFVEYGAPVLSVVTEQSDFGGSLGLLRGITQAVGVPVLRKDFIKSLKMLEETAESGAAAVLLICACMDEDMLHTLYDEALALGLEPLVEVHNEQELALARQLEARLIGINNRNIATLELDEGGPSHTAALASGIPEDALLISESGILSPEDAHIASSAGANAILVGTALWQADDMRSFYQSLRIKKKDSLCALS